MKNKNNLLFITILVLKLVHFYPHGRGQIFFSSTLMIYEVRLKEFNTEKVVWISDTSYHYFFIFIRQYNSHFNDKILLINFTVEFPHQVFFSFKKLRINKDTCAVLLNADLRLVLEYSTCS